MAGFNLRMDQHEAFDIMVSVLAIALVFTFHQLGLNMNPSLFLFYMAAAVVTLGSGFVLHELAHKYTAIKYGARARFQAWPAGLALALALVVVPQIIWGPGAGIFFIAPGAVYIYATRPISMKENGIISLAGPATNLVLAIIFLLPLILIGPDTIGMQFSTVLYIGVMINSWLALFNLIPIFPLDGSKVLAWDWKVWLLAILFSLFLLSFPVV